MSAWLQIAVVAAIVVWAAWRAFVRLAPRLHRRGLAALAVRLDRPGRAAVWHALGRRLRRERAQGGSCGDGCGSCASCGPAQPADADRAQPLVFHRRPPVSRGRGAP
ncbi:MAG: hypothetical protein DI564_01445 [Rhodanobacter denitrificans]|uniref:Uncharacterized protein n=1 Tax=Rhodanobacter denitrificans TaxID=666685 RepID=A0A2W5KXF9_9GAMM|nr:MAG: hypothetical protein DI564_01445 [Rhodanobacter denitrificans]